MLRIVLFTWPINTRMIHVCLYLLMHVMYVTYVCIFDSNALQWISPSEYINNLFCKNVKFQGFKTPFYDLGSKI
jgi:hypothetical protein